MSKIKVPERKRASSAVQTEAERALTSLAHSLDEQDIAALAYELWQARGCPDASPEEDWYRAVEQLRPRK